MYIKIIQIAMKREIIKTVAIALCFGLSITTYAQTDSLKAKKQGKNLLKINLTAIPLNNYSLIYERAIGKKIAFGLGFRFMPEGNLPFLSQLEKELEADTYQQIKDFKTSNMAITPEFKFYFGKGVFRGFYIAPFGRYAEFKGAIPFSFEYDHDANQSTPDKKSNINLSGKITSTTGGLLFGAQWKLSRLIYLDWSILGPHYGSAKGNIAGTLAELSDPNVRKGLEEELKDLEESDIPLVKIKTTVTNKDARADFSGPWAGVRASIGLGFRF
jgi:hypothetical protein